MVHRLVSANKALRARALALELAREHALPDRYFTLPGLLVCDISSAEAGKIHVTSARFLPEPNGTVPSPKHADGFNRQGVLFVCRRFLPYR